MVDPSEAPHPWRRALAWLAFLGPFFFATYAFANWTASLHTAVPSIVFDWERHIPFLPWTIVPYWIIDALYGISLFLCASKRELDTHALRLLTAHGSFGHSSDTPSPRPAMLLPARSCPVLTWR